MSSVATIKTIPYTTTSGAGNPQLSSIQQMKLSNQNHTTMINQLAGMGLKKTKSTTKKIPTKMTKKINNKNIKKKKCNKKTLYKLKKNIKKNNNLKKFKQTKKIKFFKGGDSSTNSVIAPTLNVSYKQTLPNDNPQSVQGVSNSINNLKVVNNTQSMYDKNAFKGGNLEGYTTMYNWGCYSGGVNKKYKKHN